MNKFYLILFSVSVFLAANTLQAQNNDFQLANRMMQQQNYEDALPILQRLYEENPDANIFFNRLIDCLMNLKDYEAAAELIDERLNEGYHSNQMLIRKGDILHTMGNREEAIQIWDSVIMENNRNMQLYYQIGNVMMNRREFPRAADLYLSAREAFGDPTLFINEVANAQMQSGNFAQAMHEYFQLIRNNPNQMNFVQQRLLRMRDRDLYETASLEIEDHIVDMDINHPAYNQMHQLYIWLLIETEQFQRALIAARQYESRTDVLNYSLYSLADQLVSNNEFELAAEAYQYYTETSNLSIRDRAKDRQAIVYHLWADYLSDYNLEDLQKRNELFQRSYQLGTSLLEESPAYESRENVIVRLAELSLDVFFDTEKARYWIERLEAETGNQNGAHLYYLKGRLALYNQQFTEARQSLTRANRNAEESGLAEKSRYFLSLTDFFAGDFEYATLQLRSLERRNVSYYANDALKLRMWIQEGKRSDTTGTILSEYADMINSLYHGDAGGALNKLIRFMNETTSTLAHNGLVEITTQSDLSKLPKLYSLVKSVNESGSQRSPLRERLLWEQATMAKIFLAAGGIDELIRYYIEAGPDSPDQISRFEDSDFLEQTDWPGTVADVEELFERLIIEFPQGFYASHAREILQNLTRPSS
jgi:tetratricopeptide (TPR) repeat protein